MLLPQCLRSLLLGAGRARPPHPLATRRSVATTPVDSYDARRRNLAWLATVPNSGDTTNGNMATRGTPNKKLRDERRRRGWKQDVVVARMYRAAQDHGLPSPTGLNINYISRWERGANEPQPHHVHLLCLAFERSSDQLGLPGDAAPRGDRMAEGEDATERRDFLTRGVGAAMSVLAGNAVRFAEHPDIGQLNRYLLALASGTAADPERVAAALAGDQPLERAIVEQLRQATRELGQRYWTNDAAFPSLVRVHLDVTSSFIGRGGPWERQVFEIVAETALLAGWSARGQQRPGEAFAGWTTALSLATECDSPVLRAQALIGRSALVTAAQAGGAAYSKSALATLNQALDLLRDVAPLTRMHALGRRAEENGASGDAAAVYRDLAEAERVAARAGSLHTVEPGIVASGQGLRLDNYKGGALVLLNEHKAAADVLEPAIAEDSSPPISRAFKMCDLATARVEAREPEAAARLLMTAVLTGSAQPRLIRRVQRVRHDQLGSFHGHTWLDELDEQLRALT